MSGWLQRDHNGLPQRAGLSPDQVQIQMQIQIQIPVQIQMQIPVQILEQIQVQIFPGGGGIRLLVGDARGSAQHRAWKVPG